MKGTLHLVDFAGRERTPLDRSHSNFRRLWPTTTGSVCSRGVSVAISNKDYHVTDRTLHRPSRHLERKIGSVFQGKGC